MLSSVKPTPELILYTRAGCGLCAEALDAIRLVMDDRVARGLAVPPIVEIDIGGNPDLERTLFDRIPIVQLGDHRVELVVTVGKLRRLLRETVGDEAVPVGAEWS